MRVLVTGASGFIGARLVAVLRSRGHAVIEGLRHVPGNRADMVEMDFAHDLEVSAWLPRLMGIDAVINAVGIFHEHGTQTFEALHARAPSALFNACVMAGVPRVVQISALGADQNATTPYHCSKREADLCLSALPLEWTIIQPSLVFGAHGMSARMFAMLASLPWIPVPGRGDQRIQPIHIDDLAVGVAALLESAAARCCVIPFVGPRPITLRQYLADLRAGMDLSAPKFVPVPLELVRVASRAGNTFGAALLTEDSLSMLMRGNTADPRPLHEILGREARSSSQFIAQEERRSLRTEAQLVWLLPLLRWSIAVVWIVTGIVSLGLFPLESSYELLARVGVPDGLAPLFLYSAAVLDLGLGFATLMMRHRRVLWLSQILLIVAYTAIITVYLPEFWLHPYGPLLKNLPMLACIYLLYRLEKR
jgi:nucleoside-diphosphate-sugar epimerase